MEQRIVKIYKQIETEKFQIRYQDNKKTGRREILLQGSNDGRHRAAHSKVNILSESGQVIEIRDIDDSIADFILKNFKYRGDTESFSIYQQDLESGKLKKRIQSIAPENVRHKLTGAERSFTSEGQKLWYHKPIFEKYKETGFGSIIRATLTNHQICASRCQFCSTISRNKRDSVTFDEAKSFVDTLYYKQAEFNRENFEGYNKKYREQTGSDIRLKGLILSGGGQPNLWPHFTEFVDYLSELEIDLGLITNGFPEHVPEEVYEKFKWIRISVTPEDASPFYPQGRFDKQYIPSTIIKNPDVTVGYSYVYGPWTDDNILQRISQSLNDNDFEYCRMLTDCNLSREMQLLAHRELAERLYRMGMIDADGNPTGKIFHQLKYHGTKEEAVSLWEGGQCHLQSYNVFWDTTGHETNGYSHCYPCDSVTVLAESGEDRVHVASERKFNAEVWGTVKNTEVERLFTEPVKPYFDPRKVCSSCLFMKNNRTVVEIMESGKNEAPTEFSSVKHLNFP